jgi:UPF0755 protein
MAVLSWFIYRTVLEPNTSFDNQQAHVFIPTGATFDQVLEEVGPLLKDSEGFARLARQKGYVSNVKAGHYVIQKGMNNNDIINNIRIKNVPVDVKFNNRDRLADLAGAVAAQIEPDSLSLLTAMADPEFLEKTGLDPDTALAIYLPNTYEMFWNISASEFCSRMKREYDRYWNQERIKKAAALDLNPLQVISLASIVQKETSKVDERPRVAGVYLNRLERSMPLQADPTVIFAKKMAENDFQQQIKRVLYKDLKLDSPYNTYMYAGVPPGPIAMPDLSSIEAVLNAEQHNYLFFVADVERPGYHLFARNLSEHNRNKAKYVKWINSQGVRR